MVALSCKCFLDPPIRDAVMEELATGKRGSGEVNLTWWKKEILQLIAEEFSGQEIADKLFISLHTTETPRLNLVQKLLVKNTVGLVREAINGGLV
jgi:DNA-binding NarL/FixJ family response regulator